MRSKVAEEARHQQAEREAAMSIAERRERLEAMNQLAVLLLMAHAGGDRREAESRLREAASAGRRRSECTSDCQRFLDERL